MLALLDWGLGGLRHPRPMTTTLGRADGPPAVMFPDTAAPARPAAADIAAPLPRVAGPDTYVPAPVPLQALAGIIVPVEGISRRDLHDDFDDTRSGGRRHEAIDILAARNTPVVAAADGVVDKLFTSKAGGLTIYERDASGGYQLYYAHLESYAPGIDEGDHVRQGQVIGFVGTSGNAPKDTPHLHFAIFRMGPERRWWKGEPVNPYPLLAGRAAAQTELTR
jgi:murein DD-endopeptidase MepM/ murein hydrolase activator NlpD